MPIFSTVVDVVGYWVLFTLGVVLVLAGLCTESALLWIIGVVVAGVAALAPDLTRLSIRAPGAGLTLERQLPHRVRDAVK